MILICYHTECAQYAEEADRLARSLAAVGMPHRAVVLPAATSWHDGVARKARVVRAALRSYSESVLYVDVDAWFHADCRAYFDELALSYDFAAHWFHGPGAGGREQGDTEYHMLSGTLWFNQTPAAHAVLDAWCRLNELTLRCEGPECRGQRNLAFVVREPERYGVHGLRQWRLPGRYCYVFRRADCYKPQEVENVVIEHLMASRENRDESAGRVDEVRRTRIAELERTATA